MSRTITVKEFQEIKTSKEIVEGTGGDASKLVGEKIRLAGDAHKKQLAALEAGELKEGDPVFFMECTDVGENEEGVPQSSFVLTQATLVGEEG